MANNQLLASDGSPFTTLGANWTAITGLSKCQVVGGFTEPNSLSVEAGQIYTGIAAAGDQIAQCTVNLTSETTTNYQLHVRIQAGAYSGYKAAFNGGATRQAAIFRMDAGAATVLKSISSNTLISAFASGDVWELCAAGGVLTLYQNGAKVCYAADSTYATGYTGFSQFSSTAIANSKGISFRSYNLIQQDGIWSKQGVIIPLTNAEIASGGQGKWNVSNVLYETNAQLITPNSDGKVYKMWFTSGGNLAANKGQARYAESNDAKAWTIRSTPVIADFGIQSLIKNGSTYMAWGQAGDAQGFGNVKAYTSSDGIAWTLQNASFLTIGGAGTWDAQWVFVQCNPVIIGGVFYFLYGGSPNPNTPIHFDSGIATSPDGITTATKNAGNPILPNNISGPITKVGNRFYTWPAQGPGAARVRIAGNAFNPSETVRYSSSDMITWDAQPVRSLHGTQLYEAANSDFGNTTSCAIINVGNLAYNYYIGAPSDGDGTNLYFYQISLAIGPTTVENIVSANEDAVSQTQADSFSLPNGDLSGNWTTPVGGTKLTIVSNKVRATTTSAYNMMYYSGASFGVNHYSQATLSTLQFSTNFLLLGVRMQSGSNSGYICQIAGPVTTLNVGAANLIKLTSGVGSPVLCTAADVHPVATDVFRLVVTQPNNLPVITLYQNGNLIMQAVDYANTYPTGAPGIGIWTGNVTQAELSTFAAGNSAVIPLYNSGAPSNLTISMRDGTTVIVAIPNGFTASSFVALLRKSGGVWDNPPDPATPANWWPYRYWKSVFTS